MVHHLVTAGGGCSVQYGLQLISDTAGILYTMINFCVGLLVALNVKAVYSYRLSSCFMLHYVDEQRVKFQCEP